MKKFFTVIDDEGEEYIYISDKRSVLHTDYYRREGRRCFKIKKSEYVSALRSSGMKELPYARI